jgi:hypothetical protein
MDSGLQLRDYSKFCEQPASTKGAGSKELVSETANCCGTRRPNLALRYYIGDTVVIMTAMLLTAFPEFFGPANHDAAMQFCINAVIHNGQLPMLARLLDPSSDLGEIGGEPGWTIEKRKTIATPGAYSTWPTWAEFRTFFFPEAYAVPVPESYSTEEQFLLCLKQLLIAYSGQDPTIFTEIPGII